MGLIAMALLCYVVHFMMSENIPGHRYHRFVLVYFFIHNPFGFHIIIPYHKYYRQADPVFQLHMYIISRTSMIWIIWYWKRITPQIHFSLRYNIETYPIIYDLLVGMVARWWFRKTELFVKLIIISYATGSKSALPQYYISCLVNIGIGIGTVGVHCSYRKAYITTLVSWIAIQMMGINYILLGIYYIPVSSRQMACLWCGMIDILCITIAKGVSKVCYMKAYFLN